jgi:hypothetical protein
MNEDIKTRASVNAIGNGALGGSMGNAGQTTGLLASPGGDIGMDATNSMGAFQDEETGGTEKFERYEECDDFTATSSKKSSAGVMGSFAADSVADSGRTNETTSLAAINSNNFKY